MKTRYLVIFITYSQGPSRNYCYDEKEEKMVDQEKIESIERNQETEMISFLSNKDVWLTLYDSIIGTVAEFYNGELLDLDYPFETVFHGAN